MKQMSSEFDRQIKAVIRDEWDHRNALCVRTDTPESLQMVGVKDLPMLYTARHLLAALGDERAARNTHLISPEVMATLPDLLEDPIMIADSDRHDGIVFLTKATDMLGLPIVAIIATGGKGTLEGKTTECNFVTSVYGVSRIEEWLARFIDRSNVLYVDKAALSKYTGQIDLYAKFPDDSLIQLSHNVRKFDPLADLAPARFFIDMDGTLAQFHAEDNYLERMTEPNFFANLKPFEEAIAKLKEYIAANPEREFFVLSGLTADAPDCALQKDRWLDQYLPEIDAAHRIYTENGDDKSLYIPSGVHARDILIDDYNKNLEDWQAAGGTSVKFVNPINDRALIGSRWQGERIRYNHPEDIPAVLDLLSADHVSPEMLKDDVHRKVSFLEEDFRRNPSQISDYLSFATHFYYLAPNNVRLIRAQFPTATYVTSSERFFAGLPDKYGENRIFDHPIRIKNGEKPFYIQIAKKQMQVNVGGEWKQPRELTKEQYELFEARQLEVRSYYESSLEPVYDVTQTTLLPSRYCELFAHTQFPVSHDCIYPALAAYMNTHFRQSVALTDGSAYDPEKLVELIGKIGQLSISKDVKFNREKPQTQIDLEADMYAVMVQHHFGVEVTDDRISQLADRYEAWLSDLTEDKRTDLDADLPIFGNVFKQYGRTVRLLDTYVGEYVNQYEVEEAKLSARSSFIPSDFDVFSLN